jgi:hypothetical protein
LQRVAALAGHNVGDADACFNGLFDLLSHLVQDGGVLCWVRLFLFGVYLCGGVRFDVLYTNGTSYMTFLLLIKKSCGAGVTG